MQEASMCRDVVAFGIGNSRRLQLQTEINYNDLSKNSQWWEISRKDLYIVGAVNQRPLDRSMALEGIQQSAETHFAAWKFRNFFMAQEILTSSRV